MNKNSILVGLSESEKTSFGKLDFADQSLPQKVFWTIWTVESEVNNGGFSLYLSSAAADSAPSVMGALETRGSFCSAHGRQGNGFVSGFPRGICDREGRSLGPSRARHGGYGWFAAGHRRRIELHLANHLQ